MAEDIQGNLQTYKLQLQQVEAALTTDPSNEELLKLQNDLEEVIALTRDLIKTQVEGQVQSLETLPAGSSVIAVGSSDSQIEEEEEDEDVQQPSRHWGIGDKCLALWREDGMYYEAVIDEITEDGEVSVTFNSYSNTDVTTLSLLREVQPEESLKGTAEEAGLDLKSSTKKMQVQKQREYLKKKKQKKQQRFKQLEEEREQEKNKWQAFSTKKASGKMKGFTRKSIFASPDNMNGRVGIGTCGIGGKPMTEYHTAEKWRKGV